MTVIDNCVSEKVKGLSALAAVMVVVIHCNVSIGKWVIPFATQWAVPFFLIVSGSFYARTVCKMDVASILKRKFIALLVPFLFWSLWGCAFSGWSGVLASLGVSQWYPVGNQPLWFVRQIMVNMAILLCLEKLFDVIGKVPFRRVLIVGCYLAFFISVRNVGSIVGMPASPFYFVLGYMFSDQLLCTRPHSPSVALICFALAGAIRCLSSDWIGLVSVMARNFGDILTIAGLWMGWDSLFHGKTFGIPKWCGYSFGVYCLHYPPLQFLHKFCNNWFLALFYPCVCFLLVHCLIRFCPSLAGVVFGGRK